MTHMLAALAGKIHGPDRQSVVELESFCDQYPYCQPAQMLLSIARKKHGQDPEGATEKRALAYAIDRQVFVSRMEKFVVVSKPEETVSPDDLPAFDELPLLITPAYEALSLPGFDQTGDKHGRKKSPDQVFTEAQLKQHKIIDRFLAADPRLMPREEHDTEGNPEQGLHDASDHSTEQEAPQGEIILHQQEPPQEQAATCSPDIHDITGGHAEEIEEDEGEINETVASLLVKFGKTDKALRIYEKLCLKYPEKSSYFAKKISDLILGLKKNTTN